MTLRVVIYNQIVTWTAFAILVMFMDLGENYKVNRCLARYSLRATTTKQPTNRALNKPAWPGPDLALTAKRI